MTNVTAVGTHPAHDIRSTDLQIADVEARIEAADSRLSGRSADLKRALVSQGGKLLVGAAVASVVAGVLLWRPWQRSSDKAHARRVQRRRDRAADALHDREDRHARRPLFGLGNSKDGVWSIFSLIGLIWPLLPFKLPSPVGPKMTAFLMGLGIPLTDKSVEVDATPPPMVEPDFNPTRYFGRWFEVARLPLKFESSCAGDVTATYTPLVDGSGLINVVNSCRSVDGGYENADGVAKIENMDVAAKLRVTFAPPFLRALPFVWADYWILHIDSGYSVALVGTPDRKNLWFLSREPTLDDAVFQRLRDHAVAEGYDLTSLIHTVQTLP